MGKWRVALLIALAIVGGLTVAQLHAAGKGKLGSSFSGGGENPLTPGGAVTSLQYNFNNTFGGIVGVTTDMADVGFATSSQLILYGLTVGDCLSLGSNSQIADSGTTCGGSPSGANSQLQFNTNGKFGGISGVTSDQANIGFATSSQLILYGITIGDCLKIGANGQIADSGGACGGTGSPGGSNGQVQFNTNGTFGGVSGATSNASSISFTTNSLVINGQAISGVSGTTGTLATVTGSLSTNCIKADGSGNLVDSGGACGGTSATNIAAGTNITTSGTTSNVTVNVVATPTFTSVTSTLVGITGWLTAPGANLQTATIASLGATTQCLQSVAGVITGFSAPCATQVSTPSIAAGTNITTAGTAANTTINVVATPSFTSVIASQNLTAATAQFAGFLTAGGASISGLSLATGTMSGNLTGTTHNLSGNLTAGTAQFTGAVTGTTAVFQTITDALLGGCLNATSGVVSSTGVSCATQTSTPSIAAGTNITTSGTAANTTINVVATPSFTSVIATGNLTGATAQITGWLTAPGVNMQTATIAGNLTGTTTVSAVGWLTAPGTNLQTATIAGALIGATANFSGNLTGTTAQFSGLVTGTTGTFQTHTGATLNLTSNLTGATAQFSGQVTGTTAVFQTVTAQNFTTVAAGFVGVPASGSGTAFLRGDNTFSTPTTTGLTTPQGWLTWNGTTRTAADSVGLTTIGFANIMSLNLVAGRTYKIDAELPIKMAATSSSIAIRLGGGATATAIVYDGWVVDSGINGIKANTQATALSTTVAGTPLTGTTGHVSVIGAITVNAAGSLILQAAAFATGTAATAVTIGRGATFEAIDIP